MSPAATPCYATIFHTSIHSHLLLPPSSTSPVPLHHTRLEALGLDLGLRGRDGGVGVGVDEAAALLPVLELGADARAHAGALAVVGAAALGAVGVGDAAARGELEALAVADVPGARVVGLHLREGGGGD